MAEKRPNIHPFFTVKKKKPTKSTVDAESSPDLSTSINDVNNVNTEEISDEGSSIVVVDDQREEDVSSSFTDDQSGKQLSKCELVCCASLTMYVPASASELQSTLTQDKRSCQVLWFNIYSWLTFCKTTKKLYCFSCRAAVNQKLHQPNGLAAHMSFTSSGFSDWKNALRALAQHNSSRFHSECLYISQQQSRPSVIARIDTASRQQQEQRRQLLMAEASSLQYLLRQGIPFRGHTEVEGNLIQLMRLRSADIPGLHQWLDNKRYLSHDIINELAKEMALIILRSICVEISERPFFSLICDESTDESAKTQLSISIRSVDACFGIHEDCLGLYELESQNAEHITTVILDVLLRCSLSLDACRGQGYDGAATMSGIHDGVAANILRKQKKAFFVHCNAHSLDLALQDLSKESIAINTAINVTKDIVNFVRRSPKRLNIAEKLSYDLSIKSSQLKPLCPTRWTVRASSMNSLLTNYQLVKSVMQEVVDQKGTSGVAAAGWLNQMENFQTFFGLKLGHLIFVATEELSCSLQRVENSLHDVLCAVNVLINYFTRIRSDEYFENFYSKLVAEAEYLTDEPRMPRNRRPPSRFITDATQIPRIPSTCTELYKNQYQNVIDGVLKALNNRFKQSIFPLLCEVQEFLITVANGSESDIIDKLCAEIQDFGWITKYIQYE
ncbi:unnamed protein product [Adineta steineri]|uniref:TTF-type domain-containing protein n=1 Tax=Adineta steineri TaxID=433720 RepID=A0A818HAU3_9BILA|nr:unnamed protein product [Adineta steineri]